MLVTYDRTQYEIMDTYGTIEGPRIIHRLKGETGSFTTAVYKIISHKNNSYYLVPTVLPMDSDRPYKPNRLVRVDDDKLVVVDGREVQEYYWAWSYSWNESGKLVPIGGERYIIDPKKKFHVIKTSGVCNDDCSSPGPFQKAFKRIRNRKTRCNYEGIIHQVCKDFGIKYIWYDKLCLPQGQKEEEVAARQEELQHMHEIYQNARCTVAVVPELEFSGNPYSSKNRSVDISKILTSEWSKRMWTLNEAFMSRNILFLGRNVHFWSNNIRYRVPKKAQEAWAVQFIFNICHNTSRWKASTTLWHTRERTSSRSNDRVFALRNMYPDVASEIKIDYKQDLYPLMIQFYGALGLQDISILYFGVSLDPVTSDPIIANQREKDAKALPSWMGAKGVHIPQNQDIQKMRNDRRSQAVQRIREPSLRFTECDVRFMLMKIECQSIRFNIQEEFKAIENSHFEENHANFTSDGSPLTLPSLHLQIKVPDRCSALNFVVISANSQNDFNHRHSENFGLLATHFLPLKKPVGRNRTYTNTLDSPDCMGGILSLTDQNCKSGIILSGIPLQIHDYEDRLFLPVVTEAEDKTIHKAVGVFITKTDTTFNPKLCFKRPYTII